MLKTITLFVSYWLVVLAALILVLSVVSCDCNDHTPPPKRTVDNTPTTVINNYNDNYNDSELNDRLTSLESRVDTVEVKLAKIEENIINETYKLRTQIDSMQSTINKLNTQYVSLNQSVTSQFNALWTFTQSLELSINEMEQLSETRYNELNDMFTALNSVVINLGNQVNTSNTNITNLQNTIEGIRVIVNNIQTNNLTVSQVQNIALNVINGTLRFVNPCGYSTPHTELLIELNGHLYAFVTDSNHKGGLAELAANTVYGSTIGCSCSFKYNVVNGSIVITKL